MDWELLADQPLGQKLIKKWFWLYFFMIISAPVAYIIKVIISNTLSVEDVGIFYSVYGLIILIATYNDFWLTESLQYFLPKYRLAKKINNCKTIIVLSLATQLVLGTIIAILMYWGAERLAINHFKSQAAIPVIQTFCFYFIGINIVQVFSSIYYAFQDVTRYGWIEFARVYTLLGFTLFFRLGYGLSLSNLSIAWILGIVAAIIAGILLFGKKYRKIFSQWKLVRDRWLIQKQLKYAFWVFLSANTWTILIQIDQQIIVNLLWAEAAGYFTNYLSMIMAYTIITVPILSLSFPIVSEIIAKKQFPKLKLLQDTLYKYFSVFAISIGWLFIVLGPEIMTVFFGQKFLPSWDLLKYAGPFLVFNVLFMINFGILAGTGKVKQRTGVLAMWLLSTVASMWIFIQVLWRWLIGAVLGTVIGWIVLRIFSLRIINQLQNISFNRIFLIKNIATIWLICIGIWYVKDQYFVLADVNRYSNLLALFVIALLYYGIIAGVNYPSLKLLRKEVKELRK